MNHDDLQVLGPTFKQRVSMFNATVAEHITSKVGTMWCAYAFMLIALVALPTAIRSGSAVVIVGWVSSYFLQLVLLSIIMVGQARSAAENERITRETHDEVLELITDLHANAMRDAQERHDSLLDSHQDLEGMLRDLHRLAAPISTPPAAATKAKKATAKPAAKKVTKR